MESESELRSVNDIEKKLSEVIFPFEEVVPERLRDWFTIYARSHGTTKELLLLSALTSTSALVGKTGVEVFKTYEENANLFLVAVAPSGSGKTPACHLGCVDPIVEHLERKIDSPLLLDVTSANGLFNQLTTTSCVPMLCIDEAHAFLTKIASPTKTNSQMDLSMERLCKLFDGDCWYVLKGNKGKRTGTSSARASMLAFTTPRQFLQKAWPKILDAENGLAERMLFFYTPKIERDLEEMADQCDQLEQLPVKSLKTVFENIYMEHNSDDIIKYSLNASARETFFKFAKPQENIVPQSQNINGQESKCQNAKRNTQVLRVALNMHTLYERLLKAISHETGDISRTIPLSTMNMAITLVETLEIYKGISEVCCQLKPNDKMCKVGVNQVEIENRILKTPGPFTTIRRVYTSFSSRNRPASKAVETAMKNLEENGLGKYKIINQLKVFYKKAPTDDLKANLTIHNISLEEYRRSYDLQDEHLTSRNVDIIEENSPQC